MNTNNSLTNWAEVLMDPATKIIASKNEIHFSHIDQQQIMSYLTDDVVDDLQKLFKKLVELLPNKSSISILRNQSSHYCLDIINTGIDLSRYTSLISQITLPVKMHTHDDHEGTRFTITVFHKNSLDETKKKNAPYYSEIQSHLTKHRGSKNEFAIQLEKIMKQYYGDESFNIEHWSRLMTLSDSQLFRKVKELKGVSPGRYLLKYRLSKAKGILLSSQDNISQISTNCGFKNLSHFDRAFKKEYGMNPSEIRHQQKIKKEMQS